METKENFDINQIQDPDKELVKAWIGTKYQEFYLQKYYKQDLGFNFSAFLIPDLFFLTRKLWIEAFAIIVLDLLILWFNGGIPYPIALVARVILGFAYYPLYSASIKRKIKKYKEQGLSYEEQLNKAKTLGGDKITVAVLVALIAVIFGAVFLGIRKAQLDYSNGRNTSNNSYYSNNRYTNNNYYNDSYKSEQQKANELEDKRLLEELEELEKKTNDLIENYGVINKDDNENYTDINLDENKVSNKERFTTKSTSGVLEYDDWKISYDSTKWREAYVPSTLDAKAMLLDPTDSIVLGYLLEENMEDNITDKEHLKEVVETIKLSFMQEMYSLTGKYVEIKTSAKKNDKDIYLLNFKDEENSQDHYIVCKQIDEDNLKIISFSLVNLSGTNSTELTQEVEKMLMNIEIKD
ncbi:MAG: DUF2628 domain-containing protein [Clostridia bacterium]|nr:DUF2628 domain-containing protein [Clostridia bacterium]